MELLIWLEYLAIWRLQREYAAVKEEKIESEDTELPVASYPLFSEPLIASRLIKSSAPNL